MTYNNYYYYYLIHGTASIATVISLHQKKKKGVKLQISRTMVS